MAGSPKERLLVRAVCDRVRAGELSALNLHSSALRPADLASLHRAMAAGVATAALSLIHI